MYLYPFVWTTFLFIMSETFETKIVLFYCFFFNCTNLLNGTASYIWNLWDLNWNLTQGSLGMANVLQNYIALTGSVSLFTTSLP